RRSRNGSGSASGSPSAASSAAVTADITAGAPFRETGPCQGWYSRVPYQERSAVHRGTTPTPGQMLGACVEVTSRRPGGVLRGQAATGGPGPEAGLRPFLRDGAAGDDQTPGTPLRQRFRD